MLQGHYTYRSSAQVRGEICKSCSCPPAWGRERGLRGWADSQSVGLGLLTAARLHCTSFIEEPWAVVSYLYIINGRSLPSSKEAGVFSVFFCFFFSVCSSPAHPTASTHRWVQSWGCACNFGEGKRSSTCAFPLCL